MNIVPVISLVIFATSTFGQIPEGTIQDQYYKYCTGSLQHIDKSSSYPSFNPNELCSIKSCFRAISHPEINNIIYKRLRELAEVNFANKIYLFLVEGEDSVEFAEKQNVNLQDDNKLIYISVDNFIGAKEISKGRKIYNKRTRRLMSRQ